MAITNGPGPTIEAQFDGDCPDCGEPIDAGDLITKVGDDWACADCAGTGDRPVTRKPAQPPARTSTDDMGY